MEVSVMASSQAKIFRSDLFCRDLRFCCVPRTPSKIPFRDPSARFRNSRLRFSLNSALPSQPVRSDKAAALSRSKPVDGVRIFVGLPLDVISDCNTINHARAITAGLKALKLLGVEGVELPVWWGIAEKECKGKYEWSGYLAIAEMVQSVGLKLHVSLCFHASEQPRIPLPEWVSRIGESHASIYYADRSGNHFNGCLSLAVDELPVLDGRTPVQVYQDFCESFKSSFSHLMGSTITGVTMSLGPDGELRYPSHHLLSKNSIIPGVGEFQCYDKNMINLLKQHAESTGNPLWGLGGPHDAPNYDQFPHSNNFFKDECGSWESSYGDFFLSWYSSQLLSHGDRMLSVASAAFSCPTVSAYGKVPLVHSWYRTRSHASELTAGFYNTANRDGYEAVAKVFARNSSNMILPGMDLSDEHQAHESHSSPESLLAQIRLACRKYGVDVSGQNSSISKGPHGFEQIKKNMRGDKVINLFMYHRMGADFFSPDHFPSFTGFIRSFNQPEIHSDDLPEEEVAEPQQMSTDSSIEMQAA
ncbi:hypothetical protein K2173_017614 [Erythroxylum novogranatense]|uniref:Beta-amylase n=1 Tax=Erythroxylum novogranatense TaxID=1862640 RepID=A0AAV8TKY7_9ROSI|nr:hypothetical protein K2173_017614 [Erythroxylum novogranatense]